MKTSISTRSSYQGGRINEVGRTIEDALVHEMNKQPLTVKKLPKSGYLILKYQTDHITYLEMKTIDVKVKSGFRYLYYSNSGKIKAVTRHLLLNISVSQEGKGYWKIDDRAASDLSKLNVTQKMNLILARVIQLMLMQE